MSHAPTVTASRRSPPPDDSPCRAGSRCASRCGGRAAGRRPVLAAASTRSGAAVAGRHPALAGIGLTARAAGRPPARGHAPGRSAPGGCRRRAGCRAAAWSRTAALRGRARAAAGLRRSRTAAPPGAGPAAAGAAGRPWRPPGGGLSGAPCRWVGVVRGDRDLLPGRRRPVSQVGTGKRASVIVGLADRSGDA